MKSYITTRTELKKVILKAFEDDNWDVDEIDIDNIVWNVIKDKKPVEEIASGEVEYHTEGSNEIEYLDVGGKGLPHFKGELFQRIGKSIKIYIEEGE
jgi:hypothetical protein